MKIETTLEGVHINGEIKIDAPDGWGKKVYYNDPNVGKVRRDYSVLCEEINSKLEEVGIEADLKYIENAGREEEHIRFVFEK